MLRTDRKKILISTSRFAEFDKQPLEELDKRGFEVVMNPFGRSLSKQEIISLLKDDIEGIIAGLEPLDAEVLKQSRLKVISRCGSGMSNVDINAAKELNITVCSTPLAPVTSVAELTVGALISLLRHIVQMDVELHRGKWIKITGQLLEGKTVLIIGFGQIGQKVATLLKPFGAHLLVYDPFLKENISQIKKVSLIEGLPLADIITCHCSGNAEVIGIKEFALMRKGVYILNASRGGVVNEEALAAYIENNIVKGAWVDTYNQEPYEGPLKQYKQVILTPHIGSYTVECRKEMEIQSVNNLMNALKEKRN